MLLAETMSVLGVRVMSKKILYIRGEGNSRQMVGFSGEADEGDCRGREKVISKEGLIS